MRKILAMLLTLLLPLSAGAEAAKDAAWYDTVREAEGSVMYLLTEAQLTAIAQLPSEEIHAVVEAMFLAAAGVKEWDEVQLWKNFRTEAEKEARSLENAAYRRQTLPWLLAVCAPGNRTEAAVNEMQPVLNADKETPLPADQAQTEPSWQAEDSVAAFEGNAHGQAYLAQLRVLGGEDARRCLAVAQAVMQRWLAEIDHDRLSGINGHYQCWMYAPDSPIDYPVVQCGNNDYYLDHLFNRQPNPAGTLFMDYRSLTGFRDPNTLIYGHHMRDGSMFHSLTQYDTPGYFDAHPYMLMVEKDAIYLVEVYAGYVTDSSDHCYDIAISGEAEMRRFTDSAAEKSDFNAQMTIDCQQNRLVTLSTCAYNFDNARCVVIGRLTLAWERTE